MPPVEEVTAEPLRGVRVATPLVFAHPFCLQVTERYSKDASRRESEMKSSAPPRPKAPPTRVTRKRCDDLVHSQLLGTGSDDDSEENMTDSGASTDDTETLSGTEAVALMSLQLLSEELQKAGSTPRTDSLLKAVSKLTQQLQDDSDDSDQQTPRLTTVSTSTMLQTTNSKSKMPKHPPRKPARPPHFNMKKPLPPRPRQDQNAAKAFALDDISDSDESVIGCMHSVDSDVQDVYKNIQTLELPKKLLTGCPARPKHPPSFQQPTLSAAAQRRDYHDELKHAVSRMAGRSYNPYKAVSTVGPLAPKRPPPPANGFLPYELHKAILARTSPRTPRTSRHHATDSEESDTDSSPPSSPNLRGACWTRPITCPRSMTASSYQQQRTETLTSVSSIDQSDVESRIASIRKPQARSNDACNGYEMIAFSDSPQHGNGTMVSSFEQFEPLTPKLRTSVHQSKAIRRQCGPCQLGASNIVMHHHPANCMSVQYV